MDCLSGMAGQNVTKHYLGRQEFADRIGITVGTLDRYSSEGRLPPPDVIVGEGPRAVRGWLPETIDLWNDGRPGRGRKHK